MTTRNLINDLLTPIGAFVKLREFRPVFLFESVERSGSAGRYSFIGLDPIETIVFDRSMGSRDGMIHTLRSSLKKIPVASEWRRRLPAGLVGFSGFEALSDAPGAAPNGSVHDAVYAIPRVIIAFDHLNHSFSIHQTDQPEPDERLCEEIIAALRSPYQPALTENRFGEPSIEPGKSDLSDRIEAAKKHIHDGHIYQTVLSASLKGETDLEPFQLYRAMRHLYPSPYLYYLDVGGVQVFGSSTETLMRLERGRFRLRPLSGLRARSDKRQEDEQTMIALQEDSAERSKHAVLADQVFDECSRICEPDSVELTRFATASEYSHDIHLLSEVQGYIKKDLDQFDAFAMAFPSGTVAGAPKQRSMEIIAELEEKPRGIYGGAVGYFSSNGTMDHAIAVRTFVFRNGEYSTRAGAIITADSDSKQLAESIISKGRGLTRAFDVARDVL